MILFGKDRTNTTICALASAEGAAGISVIRISGSDCLSIVRKSARFLPENLASHTIYFGTFIDPSSDELVDEVLISFFANKKSYTGEETIEISCHGSPIIVDKILEILCRAGCKVALNGEFTYRAFLNGKIDLVKAESILGLIHSSTEASAKANLNLLKGSLSNRIKHLENSVLEVLAHIEADIDFSTENLNTFEPQQIVERLQNIIDEITKICTR
jgi:tRNA modification GTPase